jgi:hypothetical protein
MTAHVSMLTNSGLISLSAEAHCPHYLGRATYLDTQTHVDKDASIDGYGETCFRYRFSGTPWPPVPFVQLSSSYGYAVRAVINSGTNQWDIYIGRSSASAPTPNVFCYGRISSFSTAEPHFRLTDSAGNPSFDFRLKPIRLKAMPDFTAYTPGVPTGYQDVLLPAGLTLPATGAPCPGHGEQSSAVGAFYRVSEYRAFWILSGSYLRRILQFVAFWSALEDGSVTHGTYPAWTAPIIDVNGLP